MLLSRWFISGRRDNNKELFDAATTVKASSKR
jgi:hypothetical protein